MRRNKIVAAGCLAALVSSAALVRRVPGQTGTRDRVRGAIVPAPMVKVRGNVPPRARREFDRGPVEGSFSLSRVTLVFKPSAGQQAALGALLDEQQNPASPNFHRWLTPEQFADRFGLSAGDLTKIVSWLEDRGFSVIETARSRTWVAFSGTAGQMSAAFNTEIHRYEVDGVAHYANAADPFVPSALAGVVLGFRSLNDFHPHPLQLRIRSVAAAAITRYTSSATGEHYLVPNDFATIYDVAALYHSGITGAGEKIAVMGQSDFALNDISTFRQNSGLGSNPPSIVLVPGSPDPGTGKNDVGEADLDLEWAGGIAPDAGIVYVNSTDSFDSLQYAIDQDLAPVMSISYGGCESDFDAASRSSLALAAMQANAEGISITSSSGDSGAADCETGSPTSPAKIATHGLAVDFPASMPYVTGLGGTRFVESSNSVWSSTNNGSNGSALAYIPEEAWNDSVANVALIATGGGASTLYPKPGWQWGTGVPQDGARDVPDVALNASAAHDAYLICSQGSCVNGFRASDGTLTTAGGTSFGAPAFAGILALIVQKTGSAQGNVNYVLYPLAARSSDAFHGITIGNNKVACQQGSTGCPNGVEIGFSAGPGYDQTTGLGSIDALNLADEWASVAPAPRGDNDFQLTAAPAALSIGAGTTSNATITLAAQNNFSGTVALTCSVAATLTGATCSISPTSLKTSGSATLTVNIPAQGASLVGPAGRHLAPGGPGLTASMGLLALLVAGLLVLAGALPRRAREYRHSMETGPTPGRHGMALRLGLGLALAGLLAAGLSCGGGSSPSGLTTHSAPPPVKGNVTVLGVSGNLQHAANVVVTVN